MKHNRPPKFPTDEDYGVRKKVKMFQVFKLLYIFPPGASFVHPNVASLLQATFVGSCSGQAMHFPDEHRLRAPMIARLIIQYLSTPVDLQL